MDQEIVLDALQELFRERTRAMMNGVIPDFYIWALNVRINDDATFSVDLYEWYMQKMIRELGAGKFQEVMVEYICSEIKENLDGGKTYTEKMRTLH